MSLLQLSRVWILCATALFCARIGTAAEMTILWDAPTDPAIVGFSVMYGTQSGAYSQRLNVGVQTSATISNLSDGVTYYFAVRSVNDVQVEIMW